MTTAKRAISLSSAATAAPAPSTITTLKSAKHNAVFASRPNGNGRRSLKPGRRAAIALLRRTHSPIARAMPSAPGASAAGSSAFGDVRRPPAVLTKRVKRPSRVKPLHRGRS